MSTTTPDTSDAEDYQLGPPHANTQGYASFETKPPAYFRDGSRDTGSGYERWRSTELRPSTARQGKEDVYVSVHRLAAIAWCYPDDMAVGEILQHLDGRDIHHTTEVEWANFGDSPNFPEMGLQVVGHGTHSEVTKAQMRAFAEDAKRQADASRSEQVVAGDTTDGDGECAGCGRGDGSRATTDSLTGEYCLECVRERAAEGDVIEVL